MKTTNQIQVEIPQVLSSFVDTKLESHSSGGRPHFVKELAKTCDPKNELLNILEEVWLKGRSLHGLARKYETSYATLYRVLLDLEPSKEQLTEYMLNTPRRKRFYMKELDQSDYEAVRKYIARAKREELKKYKTVIQQAQRCWTALNYKDPANWTPDEVISYLHTLKGPSQADMLVNIRQVAPHLKEEVATGKYREKIGIRKKDIFGPEVRMIVQALTERGFGFELLVFLLHITTGAREGSRNIESGLCGLSWDRFHNDFRTVDLWESKVRGGIWSRNCPVDLFFKDLPEKLKRLWEQRGRPTEEKLILGGYKELMSIYKTISMVLKDYYQGKAPPDLLKELSHLIPHDADKIHVNLLWEAEVPLEVVAGQYLGRGEGLGLVGRIWLNIDVIKKFYLSLTQRSERFQKLRSQVTEYSEQFNGELVSPLLSVSA
jgi:hypothetical protein